MGGSRNQVNKAHKTRFASKASRHEHKTSLKAKSTITKDHNGKGARAARMQRNKMLRDQKRAAILKEKRASSGSTSSPRVIVLFGLSAAVNLNSLAEEILSLLSKDSSSALSSTVASSEYKLRTTVLKAPHGDLLSCIEMAKFMWLFKEQRLSVPHWRSQRAYLMAQKVHVSGAGDYQLCKIEILKDPYPLNARKETDIMDSDDISDEVVRCLVPDPLKQEPLLVENVPDPLAGEQNTNDYDLSDDNASLNLRDSDEETDVDSVMMDGENLTREQLVNEIQKLKKEHADDEEFPMKWIPYRYSSEAESLTSRLCQNFAFDNFARTQKHVLSKALEMEQVDRDDCAANSYTKLYIKEVPSGVCKLCISSKTMPVIACGLLQHESKMSVLHFRPIYSTDSMNSNKHKMERFLHAGRFSMASVYAPISFPPLPLIAFKYAEGDVAPSVAAVGSLRSIDPDRIILKKIILTGYPQRVSKLKASVRYMFHNPEDVKWFKPVEVFSKCGAVAWSLRNLLVHMEALYLDSILSYPYLSLSKLNIKKELRGVMNGVQECTMSGKIVQNVFVSQWYPQNRQSSTQFQGDHFVPYMRKFLPFQGGKVTLTDISSMHLRNLSNYQSGFANRRTVHCNAAPSTTALSPLDKVDFLKLQNGSDIRGVAIPGVEGEPVNLTEPVAEAIAAAFSAWLNAYVSLNAEWVYHSLTKGCVKDAISRGISGAGLDVIQYGLASTPAMFNSTLTDSAAYLCPVDGSIMITASHLPYNRNGFKFFTSAGGLGKPDIKDILERAADIYSKFKDGMASSEEKVSALVKRVDYMSVYTSGLVNAVRKAAGNLEKPLEGFHIVVDAGNGAGGFFAAKVLEPLGAVTFGSQFLEPDGMFPNHIPNPEDKTAMKAITKAVLDNKADLGIIFDTDVDRSAAVDSTGREFNRNRLIALMSAIVLEEHPGTTIVTDSVTSDGLTTFIEKKLGGKHHRFKRGYKNVIDEAIRLNSIGEESHLAIETSGHGALKENHWLDDGAYLMVKILNKLASARAAGQGIGSKVLTDLVEGLKEPAVAVELRLKINQNHPDLKGGSFRNYGEAVLKHLENSIEADEMLRKAPVRVSGFGGWFLLRLSLHDPVLPLNIEASSHDDAVKLGHFVLAATKEFSALDTSALDKFVQV
uniref:phosphoglucomutase (alpha-D-glucose-1,6-bisphosphate-dependent) n=1 Tax=Cannabis sativa TaxID=3483 RepID=A0A803P252_CANSA